MLWKRYVCLALHSFIWLRAHIKMRSLLRSLLSIRFTRIIIFLVNLYKVLFLCLILFRAPFFQVYSFKFNIATLAMSTTLSFKYSVDQTMRHTAMTTTTTNSKFQCQVTNRNRMIQKSNDNRELAMQTTFNYYEIRR